MGAAPQPASSGADRVALEIDDRATAAATTEILQRRGVYVADGPSDDGEAVVALARKRPITIDEAAELAELCMSGAHRRKPLVVLAAWPDELGDPVERAAALGYLRCFGGLVCTDPSTWIETLVLVARLGLPLGPRLAIVAEPHSLLSAQASALEREYSRLGARLSPSLEGASDDGHDAVLVDIDSVDSRTPTHVGGALVVPVCSRGELATASRPALVDLRHAMAALRGAGRLALRIDQGIGPAPEDAPSSLGIDRERFDRQLGKLGKSAGDHETKVLLAAYGVDVSRQAVATTPSAAVRIAKRAGFPVDIKPWGPDIPSEYDGCPVERELMTAADVRRGYAAAIGAADLPSGAAVIVRASPPPGQELRAELIDLPEVGWTAVVYLRSRPQPVAAPAPLSLADSRALASAVVATRADDTDLDTTALSDLLTRVSYLVWDHGEDIERLDLGRILLPEDGGAMVVDAIARLRR
ncbi:MAG: acetate--CoA ligase family protein [Deltaproteobacteria bacterium]|jgi:acetyltransferase|nr:acetate--CoA ligase family protein [Deltaproteobacteria bacterium]